MIIKDSGNPFRNQEEKRYSLRIDAGLYDAICSLAKYHNRSTAKEIEIAVEEYLSRHDDLFNHSDADT